MKDKLKVLILHNIVSPYRLPLFEKLNEKYDLEVFFCEKNKETRKWETDPEEYSFKSKFLKGFKLGPFYINYTLPLDLIKNKYDIYMVNMYQPMILVALTALFFAKIFRKPFIVWTGIMETEWYREEYMSGIRKFLRVLYEPFRRLVYVLSNAFIAYSTKTKEFLMKRGVEENKIFIGGQVMPKSRLPEPKTKKEDTKFKDKFIILYLGYLRKRKGLKYLIKAYKKADLSDSVLIIVGTGRDEQKFKELAGDRSDITFTGYVKESEKVKYYSIADLFVLPTLHDPSAQVINEAMFYGLPIIDTYADGAFRKIEKRNCGIIIEPKNTEALKKAITKLYENEELRKKMAENAEMSTINYDLNEGVKPFLDSINHVTK